MDNVLLPGLEPCSVHHSDHLFEILRLQSEIGRRIREDTLAHAICDDRLGYLLTVRHLQSREHRLQGHLERVSLVDPDVLLMHHVPDWSHIVDGHLRGSCLMYQTAGGMSPSY